MNLFSQHKNFLRLVLAAVFFCCVSMSFAQEVKTSNQLTVKPKVEVFPNPTVSSITIDLSGLDLTQPKLEIRSIIGNKMIVEFEKQSSDTYKADVKSFPRGYYLLVVRDDRKRFQQTTRFSKK